MNEFGRNYPAQNHWGNLKGAGKVYSLQVQAPGVEITGLDKSITEMCATVSAVLEDGASDVVLALTVEASQTKEQRQEAKEYNETAFYNTIQTQVEKSGSGLQLLKDDHIFDDHGELKFALAPMATAIVQTNSGEVTMIVGWRGTCTAVDWLQDIAVAPIISKTLNEYAPGLRVHAGMAALVENDMTTNGKTILKHIKDNNVTQVVFTGHSLGGGNAYVAHLYALATWAQDLPTVTFRALAFEAPMAFYLPDEGERTKELKKVLKTLEENSRNFVFCGDIVPRISGNGTYVKEVFNKLGMQNQGIVGVVAFAKKFAGETVPTVAAKINDLVNNMGKYDHCSQLIYYEKAEGEPELLSAIDFKTKTLEAALGNIKFKNSEAKIPLFGLKTALNALEGFDFEDIGGYVTAVHGVLPYAMSPVYENLKYTGENGHVSPMYKDLKYSAKGETIAEYKYGE